MAVQAQYPANLLFLNRGETERNSKEMETEFSPPLLQQSPVFNATNGGIINSRKRARLAAPSIIASRKNLQQQKNAVSLPSPTVILKPSMLGVPQFHSSILPGFCFTINEQNQIQNRHPDSIISFSEEVSAQYNHQTQEIEQFLSYQRDNLRREMAAKQQHHYSALLAAVEKSLGHKLREKEAEVQRAAQRTAELHGRLTHLRTESIAWQAKAMSEQAAAASLHAQLQLAAATAASSSVSPAGEDCCGESPTDAGSAHVDPDRTSSSNRPCRVCLIRPASVVLLPCCHLSVCPACELSCAGCPACGCIRTGSLHVSFS